MSVFSKDNAPKTDLKRNTFDLSFTNNFTANFGGLYPVLCQEVIPGDTFQCDCAFGLQFMPTVFTIQNRIRADVHFFYVRSRNLWNEWKQFITNNKTQKAFPTINTSNTSFSVGSLGDYFGLTDTVLLDLETIVSADDDLFIIPE